ncbi:serine/threonine-protein kinase Nek1-like isoform X1 [Carassius gibelio]|uniref:serine/threonine-protein kinase Nek1-like isoform X1 n=1 Tax=Carassius gibelio TaxID=101364 RepID=UPI0022778198|nr:serine/threonine-protein kinase Nek1-like isoform X1 [Carassius gibelio]
MLRTCSLPDLSKVFSDAAEAEGAVAPDSNLEIEDLEDKADEQSESEDVYEDDDLRELRASMERLLREQRSNDDDDDEDEEDGGGSNSSPADEEAAGRDGLARAGDDKHSPEEQSVLMEWLSKMIMLGMVKKNLEGQLLQNGG